MKPTIKQETEKAAHQSARDEEKWEFHRESELARESAGILAWGGGW